MTIDLSNAPVQEEFQVATVTKVTLVKRARLQTWLENGWIVPSIQVGDGPGVRNIFNRNDLYWIAIFKTITEIGLPRKLIGGILTSLKELSSYSLCEVNKDGEIYIYHTIFCAYRDGDTRANLLTGADFGFGETISGLGLDGYDYSFVFNTLKAITFIDEQLKKL